MPKRLLFMRMLWKRSHDCDDSARNLNAKCVFLKYYIRDDALALHRKCKYSQWICMFGWRCRRRMANPFYARYFFFRVEIFTMAQCCVHTLANAIFILVRMQEKSSVKCGDVKNRRSFSSFFSVNVIENSSKRKNVKRTFSVVFLLLTIHFIFNLCMTQTKWMMKSGIIIVFSENCLHHLIKMEITQFVFMRTQETMAATNLDADASRLITPSVFLLHYGTVCTVRWDVALHTIRRRTLFFFCRAPLWADSGRQLARLTHISIENKAVRLTLMSLRAGIK